MDLLELIIKLAKPQSNEIDRYWRLIVYCFLVDKLEQLELGILPTKFKQYYGRTPSYSGKLLALVEELEFKAICITVKQNSTWLLRPSEFIRRALGSRLDRPDPKELLIPALSNNNNTNVIHPANPFAIDALKELEKNEESEGEIRFGRLTLEELNCGICFDLLKEAVEGNCCKSIFCLPCIKQYDRKCPLCRRDAVEWSVNEPIRRLVGKKPIKCNYKDCIAWSTVSEIEQHRAGCEFNPNFRITCQNCQQQIMRRLLQEHLSDTCEMVKLPCRTCGSIFFRKDINNHETQLCELSCPNLCGETFQIKMKSDHLQRCPLRPVPCHLGCGKSFAVNAVAAIDEHVSNQCPKRQLPCKFCQRQYPANKINLHLSRCKERPVTCEYCQEQFTLKNHKQHVSECPKRPVECKLCGEQVPIDNYKNHLSNLCLKRPLPCPICKIDQPAGDLQEHTNKCPKRLLKCPQCKESVTGRNYDQHVSEQCRHRVVACPQCDQQVVFSDLTHHLNQVCPQRKSPCQKCHKLVMLPEYENHMANECTARILTCEKCKGSVVASEYDTHLSQCQKPPCKWCHGYLEPASLVAHENDCLERVLTCPACNNSFTTRNYNGHRNECPRLIDEGNDSDFKRQVSCDKCQELVLASFKSWHDSDMCLERTVECEKCMLPMLFKDLDSHQC